MTDKQIIIDGVDVSGCEYFEDEECLNPSETVVNCEASPNCYYKQLKAKEQECEELKIYIESNEQQVKEVETLVMDNDRLINELDLLKAENEELKKIIERLDVPKHEVIDMDIALENEKLKQTLTEIETEMRKILMVGNGIDGKYRPVKNSSKQDCYQVLGKIQEILGTNQIKISEVEDEN